MGEHVFHGPKDHAPTGPLPADNLDNCPMCVLSCCKICGGAEASLPMECPGVKMRDDQKAAVQSGHLDYHHNQWWALGEPVKQRWWPDRLAPVLDSPTRLHGHQMVLDTAAADADGYCQRCQGSGPGLPTDCPGILMTTSEQLKVALGDRDFRKGAWVNRTMDAVEFAKEHLCDWPAPEPLSETGPWPEVVMFQTPDGWLHPYPPKDGRAYHIRIQFYPGTSRRKLPEYEELARSGRLYTLFDHDGADHAAQPWRAILDLPPAPAPVNDANVSDAYRRKAFEIHPDRGGTHEDMVTLQMARDAAYKDIGVRQGVE